MYFKFICCVLYFSTGEKGGTLVICPASLLNQWEGEVNKRVKRGIIDLEIYHGTSRESKPRR
jgi:transcription termination factor 2